jgi:hypothetical protein
MLQSWRDIVTQIFTVFENTDSFGSPTGSDSAASVFYSSKHLMLMNAFFGRPYGLSGDNWNRFDAPRELIRISEEFANVWKDVVDSYVVPSWIKSDKNKKNKRENSRKKNKRFHDLIEGKLMYGMGAEEMQSVMIDAIGMTCRMYKRGRKSEIDQMKNSFSLVGTEFEVKNYLKRFGDAFDGMKDVLASKNYNASQNAVDYETGNILSPKCDRDLIIVCVCVVMGEYVKMNALLMEIPVRMGMNSLLFADSVGKERRQQRAKKLTHMAETWNEIRIEYPSVYFIQTAYNEQEAFKEQLQYQNQMEEEEEDEDFKDARRGNSAAW